jgi:hypothetical protein
MYVLGFLADLYRVLKSSAIKKTTLNAGQSGPEDNLTDNPSFLLNDIKASEKFDTIFLNARRNCS